MSENGHNGTRPQLRVINGGGKPHSRRPIIEELMDSALLVEINRRVLHPFGISLNVEVDEETGAFVGFALADFRDTPEDCFHSEAFLEEARGRLRKFLAAEGEARLQRRRAALGFEVQGKDELKLDE